MASKVIVPARTSDASVTLTNWVAAEPKMAVAPAALGTTFGVQFGVSFQEPPIGLFQVDWAAARGGKSRTRARAAATRRRSSKRFMGGLRARFRGAVNRRIYATKGRKMRPDSPRERPY